MESNFINLVSKLLVRPPDQQFSWTVEAVFCDSNHPETGAYATMGVFATEKEAHERSFQLANEFEHNFLVFRHRKMYHFNDFVSKTSQTTVLRDDDVDYNKRLFEHNKRQVAMKKEYEKKSSLLDSQMEKEEVKGTPENITKLVYLCNKTEEAMRRAREEMENAATNYELRMEELQISLKDASGDWKEYAKEALDTYGEKGTFEVLEKWWDTFKKKSTKSIQDTIKSGLESLIPEREHSTEPSSSSKDVIEDDYSSEEIDKLLTVISLMKSESLLRGESEEDLNEIQRYYKKVFREFVSNKKEERFVTADKQLEEHKHKGEQMVKNLFSMFTGGSSSGFSAEPFEEVETANDRDVDALLALEGNDK
jgi:hypothetical protein